jgi:murein L,D-transpeptidase YcbB/YkuD
LEALETSGRQVVYIPKPIAIHLNYMTAWVDENGHLQFRQDIYQRDRQLDYALIHRTPPYALPPLMSPKGQL